MPSHAPTTALAKANATRALGSASVQMDGMGLLANLSVLSAVSYSKIAQVTEYAHLEDVSATKAGLATIAVCWQRFVQKTATATENASKVLVNARMALLVKHATALANIRPALPTARVMVFVSRVTATAFLDSSERIVLLSRGNAPKRTKTAAGEVFVFQKIHAIPILLGHAAVQLDSVVSFVTNFVDSVHLIVLVMESVSAVNASAISGLLVQTVLK